MYEKENYENISLEGTVRSVSSIPDPQKNDYDDCLYSIMVEVDSVLSKNKSSDNIAKELILNVPIMKDKSILKDNIFRSGDKIKWACVSYDDMPEKIREIQLSDEFQSFEHDYYYVLTVSRINSFSTTGTKNFSKRQVTIHPIQSLPKDENATKLRKKRIQDEIARIENELKKHGGTFSSWKEEYKPIAAKYKQLISNGEYKCWINDCYFFSNSPEITYDTKSYIDGIMPYKKYLEENNIDLIVLRIPMQSDFVARVMASDDFQENPAWIEHYYECLKNDIEIVDPMPEMWKHRFDFPLFYLYNYSHPGEGTAFIAAKEISNVLKRYSFENTKQEISIEDIVWKASSSYFFWPAGNDKYNSKNNITFKQVVQNGKTIGFQTNRPDSPFIFLSNSFFSVPQANVGASVPGYVSYFLQHIPAWSYQAGLGNPMLRNLVSNSVLLNKRKAVVMVGYPHAWGGGFPKLPRYILDKAKTISLEKTLDFMSSEITIEENDHYLFQKNDDGVVKITQNKERYKNFSACFSLPAMPDKKICMMRINFKYTDSVFIRIFDKENHNSVPIDIIVLPSDYNQHADFFIPVSDYSRNIKVRFSTDHTDYKLEIRNIELWYY